MVLENAGESVEKREPSFTIVGDVNWYNHYGKQYGGTSENNVELPYDPAIPLLGIYLDNTFIKKDACTPIFIAALFTIAKTWKQPKCPSTDEWIKKMCYIYTWNSTQPKKKNKIMPFAATWMELEIFILSEVSQKEKDK